MITGTQAFVDGLRQLGYQPAVLTDRPDHVVIDYEVETGRFAARKVQLGFVVPPDFPLTAPSGPHVSPHIHPVGKGGQHPDGAVHDSVFTQALGGEWQYWSRPFPDWGNCRRTVAAYMSHIWRLWDSQ